MVSACVVSVLTTILLSPLLATRVAFLLIGACVGFLWKTALVQAPNSYHSRHGICDENKAPPRIAADPTTFQKHASRPESNAGATTSIATSTCATTTSASTNATDVPQSLSLELAKGAILIADSSDIIKHDINLVLEAAFSKFDGKLPHPKIPDLLNIECLEDATDGDGRRFRRRHFLSKLNAPSALRSMIGAGDTSILVEDSLEIAGDEATFICYNKEYQEYVQIQVLETLKRHSQTPKWTVRESKQYVSPVGLPWPLSTTFVSFARSEQKAKGSLPLEVLLERCEELASEGRPSPSPNSPRP